MSSKLSFPIVTGAVLLLALPTAHATVLVDIGNGAPVSWTAARDAGHIAPVDVLTAVAEEFYDGAVGETMAPGSPVVQSVRPVLPQLTPDVMVQGRQALVMDWQDPATSPGSILAVAAWDYWFDANRQGVVDMSSGSSKVHFSLLPPPGMWDISFELIDSMGRAKGWFLPMPSPDMQGRWNDCWIMVNGGTQDACMTGMDDWLVREQLGFDISQIARIRLDEAGRSIDLTAAGAALSPTTGGIVWNAWDHLRVEVGAPASLSLALLGLLLSSAARAGRARA